MMLVAPFSTVAPWMRSPWNTISLASIAPLAGTRWFVGDQVRIRGFDVALNMEMKPRGSTCSACCRAPSTRRRILKETREGAELAEPPRRCAPPREGGEADMRAAKEGKVEYYIPLQRAHPVEPRAVFSGAHPDHLSVVRKNGGASEKIISRKPRQKCAAGRRTKIPTRARRKRYKRVADLAGRLGLRDHTRQEGPPVAYQLSVHHLRSGGGSVAPPAVSTPLEDAHPGQSPSRNQQTSSDPTCKVYAIRYATQRFLRMAL